MKQKKKDNGGWQARFEPDQFVLQVLENNIITQGDFAYPDDHIRSLLEQRKEILNHLALRHQEELLPEIAGFNEALKRALRKMYDKACRMWECMTGGEAFDCEYMQLTATCFLDYEWPKRHPVQNRRKDALWQYLSDTGYNRMYKQGTTISPLMFSTQKGREEEPLPSFDKFIWLGDTKEDLNWNEGLNEELTKDLHLISGFHQLFSHTDFALTDFIYCRDFNFEFTTEMHDK